MWFGVVAYQLPFTRLAPHAEGQRFISSQVCDAILRYSLYVFMHHSTTLCITIYAVSLYVFMLVSVCITIYVVSLYVSISVHHYIRGVTLC
jgi:hypothetical protein